MNERRVVLACLLMGCTARPEEPQVARGAGAAHDGAEEVKEQQSDRAEEGETKADVERADLASPEPTEPTEPAEPVAPSVPPNPECAVEGMTGPPWEAFGTLMPSFPRVSSPGCPTGLRVVQRRPWYELDTARVATPKRSESQGEIFEITGRDPQSGVRVWASIAHAPRYHYRDDMNWVIFDYQPGCSSGRIQSDWYCLKSSTRGDGGAEPLHEWLKVHPEVARLEWIGLKMYVHTFELDEIDWSSKPRVLLFREERKLTVCWLRGEDRRCWQLDGIDAVEILDEDDSLALATKTGKDLERWSLSLEGNWVEYEEEPAEHSYDEDEEQDPAPDYEVGDITRWTPLSSIASEHERLARAYSSEVIRTRGDGLVLGHYDEVGGAGVAQVVMAEWLLTRGDAGWVATATPDLVVHDVVRAGGSLGVVASRFLLGDGPAYERRDLLMFTSRDRAMEYAGQLDSPVGVSAAGYDGEYEWSYAITSAGPDCLKLAPGTWSGETFDDLEEGHSIGKRARALFRGLSGQWQITPEGPRRGCSRR